MRGLAKAYAELLIGRLPRHHFAFLLEDRVTLVFPHDAQKHPFMGAPGQPLFQGAHARCMRAQGFYLLRRQSGMGQALRERGSFQIGGASPPEGRPEKKQEKKEKEKRGFSHRRES